MKNKKLFMRIALPILFLGSLSTTFALSNNERAVVVKAEEVIATTPSQSDDKKDDLSEFKDQVENAWNTYIVPLCSGLTVTTVLSFIFSAYCNFKNKKNNKESANNIQESNNNIKEIINIVLDLIKNVSGLYKECQNYNKIANETRIAFETATNDLIKKIESQTSATENLMELKQILVLLAEIETKLAVNDPNAIKAGISEDIVILNEQIKNLK